MAICSTGEAFFQSMILHEVCGHGFAKLADEYTRPGAPDAAMRSNIIAAQRDGIYMNIDVECGGDKTLTKWSGFVGKAGYENVGAFEGAFMFTDGVWRSEEAESCMDDESIHYFNAPSRWMQARRVMALSGEDADFTIDEFIAVDKEKQ